MRHRLRHDRRHTGGRQVAGLGFNLVAQRLQRVGRPQQRRPGGRAGQCQRVQRRQAARDGGQVVGQARRPAHHFFHQQGTAWQVGAGRQPAVQRGRVAVALLPSLAAGWLPGVLAQYRTAHPGIEIDIADVLSEPCIDRVASGHADFALAAIRADTPALQAEPFCSDNFYLVCPADHPLARRRKAITAQDLATWPFIHLARTSSVRQYLEAALHPQAMHTLMEVEQLATVMGMVRAGLGISVVPALTLFHFEQPGLVTRPLSLPGLTRQIYLVRRRDESLSVAAQALYALVMAQRP